MGYPNPHEALMKSTDNLPVPLASRLVCRDMKLHPESLTGKAAHEIAVIPGWSEGPGSMLRIAPE
jgi:hypothetical protein